MAKNLETQVNDYLENRNSFLILLPKSPSTDAICASLVLRSYLASKQKQVTIYSEDFQPSEKLAFLQSVQHIQTTLQRQDRYIIEIDTAKSPVEELTYEMNGDKLQILLSPKPNQAIAPESIQHFASQHQFDGIITINVSELAAIGSLIQTDPSLIDETPILAIDHRPEHEQYGQINWIDLTASSTCEQLYSQLYITTPPTKGIATMLIAGIMEKTHAFRAKNTKAKTLKVVSKLLEVGADHETVVNHLYRTKTVNLLRLWGHILDHLQADREHSLAWSIIPQTIFSLTGTKEDDVQDLLQEVLSHSPDAKTIVLFIENPDSSIGIHVSTTPPLHAKDLIKNWQPVGSERIASAKLKRGTLAQAEEHVIRLIKERLDSVLSKNPRS